jgi:hypothetical protein
MAFVICTILSRAPDLSHSTLCFKRHFKLSGLGMLVGSQSMQI